MIEITKKIKKIKLILLNVISKFDLLLLYKKSFFRSSKVILELFLIIYFKNIKVTYQ